MLVPNDGVRGIDVTTERGVTKYDANKSGVIEVQNPAHARTLRAQGFTEAGVGFSKSANTTDECGCGSVKFGYQAVCSACYIANLGVKDGERDKPDTSTGK